MKRWRILVWAILVTGVSLRGGTLAQFRTPLGTMDVELFEQDKPVTVRNFIRYVEKGVYTNMFFHRWVPNFVIQGGGYGVSNRVTGPIIGLPAFGPITNEFTSDPRFSNTYGTIAMAKVGGDPNSATSEWFFNLANNAANLDVQNGGFTVFGVVRSGTNILNRFNSTTTANGVFVANLGVPLDQVPVLSTNVTYSDLVYVDITLLGVEVGRSNNFSQVTWNSIASKTNVLERTAVFPPVWQRVTNFVANGSRVTVTDPATNSAYRFYRVRVNY